jgi:hypothetical protein
MSEQVEIDFDRLVEFLLARIGEDESKTGVPDPQDERTWSIDPGVGDWPMISPARILAECYAKRRIIDEIRIFPDVYSCDAAYNESQECNVSEMTLRLLALPYADHPDYDESWRPE